MAEVASVVLPAAVVEALRASDEAAAAVEALLPSAAEVRAQI